MASLDAPGMEEKRHHTGPDGRNCQHQRRAAHPEDVYRQIAGASKEAITVLPGWDAAAR
jgi:hypothetical protein